MEFLADVFEAAFAFLGDSGGELARVVLLTLVVAGLATAIGVAIGVPFGIWLGLARFRGRGAIWTVVNVGMGMPPVLVGLFVLLLLWSDGPLGPLNILFTPAAMVIVQVLLALPIAAGVTAGAVAGLAPDAREQLDALHLTFPRRGAVVAKEVWPGVTAAIAATFGRVVSEVGAVLIVGGNILGETRVLTTAIVQETRQARFGAAVALGIVLLVIAFSVNGTLTWLQFRGRHVG
ncbi:MAG: ABC transporter permease [Acidimicrobiia bacterium]|nr:MAG: ABC transporter permease [Acidimicrobiia bacterium]